MRRLKQLTTGSVLFQVTTLGLVVALCSLSPLVSAQRRTFTGKAITGGHTSALAKRDVPKPTSPQPVRSPRKGADKRTMKTNGGPAGPCSVSIAPGPSPAGGYLALSGFNLTPVVGVSDDSITDFDVPRFTFAGETYSRIGFSSNGYAIVGGSADPSDNTTLNQTFPDATLPNNVLAPFWTDLNPENGGNLYIGVLTDGMDNWVVLDWEAVSEFSTANQNSFEMWIGLDGDANPGEDVSYAYGTLQGSGNNGFLTVGAENKFGSSGQTTYYNGAGTLPANGTQLRVSTTTCLATKPWSAAGSTGTIDEDSLATASVTNFVLGFQPGATGTIGARYNITPTHDIARLCPATASKVTIRFRDEDDVGTGDQVLLAIHRTNIASGGDSTIFTFDSNVSAQPRGSAFQTFTTDASIDFDFATGVYWVDVQISRSNPNAFVNLGSIQIYENTGTPCP